MDTFVSPIFVTGCPRSGTSIIAEAISLCGVFTGDVSAPNNKEPYSLFENRRMFSHLLAPYLKDCQADTKGQFPLPITNKLMLPLDWRNMVWDIMRLEGYFSGPWLFKSNLLALTWPVWHYAFPNAKWIIVRRRTGDIVNSCLHSGHMLAFKSIENQKKVNTDSENESWVWWVHEYEKRFVDMIQAGLNVKIVWPERMVRGDYRQMYDTVEWLGLKWVSAITECIDPKFWSVRQKKGDDE